MSSSSKLFENLNELSKEEIQNQNIAYSELWLIQYKLDTKGPFHYNDLVKNSEEFSNVLADCLACNLKQKSWRRFFEHSVFQKRAKEDSPSTFKKEEIEFKEFHILIDGLKSGPFKAMEIQTRLVAGELSMNNLISSDGGKSWRKVYKFPIFDRRQKEGLDLQTPTDKHFEKSKIYTSEYLKKLNLKKEDDSLEKVLLACQEHLDHKKTQIVNSIDEKLAFFKDSNTESSQKNAVKVGVLALLLLLAIPLFFLKSGSKNQVTKKSNNRNSRAISNEETTRKLPVANKAQRSNYADRNRANRRRNRLDNRELEDNQAAPSFNREAPVVDIPRASRRNNRRRPRRDTRGLREDYVDNDDDDYLNEENLLDPEDEDLLDDEDRSLASDGLEDSFDLSEEAEAGFDDGIEEIDFE